jgi:hypothetical protein
LRLIRAELAVGPRLDSAHWSAAGANRCHHRVRLAELEPTSRFPSLEERRNAAATWNPSRPPEAPPPAKVPAAPSRTAVGEPSIEISFGFSPFSPPQLMSHPVISNFRM